MPNETLQLPLPGIAPAELPRISDPVVCQCPACGGEFDEDDGRNVEDAEGLHCPDCAYSCDECGRVYSDSDAIVTASSDSYSRRNAGNVCLCEDCRWQCADCNEYFANDAEKSENVDHDAICMRCAENYNTCEDCNAIVHNDSGYYHEGREVTLCNICYRDQCRDDGAEENGENQDGEYVPPGREESTTLHDYNYQPRLIFLLMPDETGRIAPTFFGLEIEAENRNRSDLESELEKAGIVDSDTWYAKKDSSIGYDDSTDTRKYDGAELVSHPGSWKYWQAHDFAIFQKLQKAKFRSYDTDTCGMHVHISRTSFTELGLWKLLEFFRLNPKLVARLSRRKGDRLERWAAINSGPGGVHVRPSRKLVKIEPIVEFDRSIRRYVHTDRTECEKVEWKHHDRYAAINLENAATVEIRIFRGTLNVDSIKRNIALCVALTEFVKYTNTSYLSQADFVRFLATEGYKSVGRQWCLKLISWLAGREVSDDSES